MKFKMLFHSIAAACAMAIAGAAAAAPVDPDFTVTTGGLGATGQTLSSLVANDIGGQYYEALTINSGTTSGTTTTGTFSISLEFIAGQFNYDDTTPGVSTSFSAGQSGLGSKYQLMAVFNDTGTYTTTSTGTVFNLNTAASPGNLLTLYYDAGLNATISYNSATGYVYNTNGDTSYTVATGSATSGAGSVTCNGTSTIAADNLCGDFGQSTSFNLTGNGSKFFTSPVPFYSLSLQSGQFEGFTVTPGTQVLAGTLNAVFTNVPEPASLAIVGAALAGLGLSRRRKPAAPAEPMQAA